MTLTIHYNGYESDKFCNVLSFMVNSDKTIEFVYRMNEYVTASIRVREYDSFYICRD
jgi:hypothetical protein